MLKSRRENSILLSSHEFPKQYLSFKCAGERQYIGVKQQPFAAAKGVGTTKGHGGVEQNVSWNKVQETETERVGPLQFATFCLGTLMRILYPLDDFAIEK